MATGDHALALLCMVLLAIAGLVWRRAVGCRPIGGDGESR
jgi:hypothetical protein